MAEEDILKEDCGCGSENCHCGEDCHCHEEGKCSENCTCGEECRCNCHEHDHCHEEGNECHCHDEGQEHCHCHDELGDHCHCHEGKESEYLDMARRIQADFDNYRRHAVEDKNKARLIGQISIIEAFLPCLDTFKEAKKSIEDENVLKGIEMIENKILDTLKSVGVERMETIGKPFDHHYHEAIAQMRDESKENDIILDEYQAGYIMNDNVVRYAKVIVNKRED